MIDEAAVVAHAVQIGNGAGAEDEHGLFVGDLVEEKVPVGFVDVDEGHVAVVLWINVKGKM